MIPMLKAIWRILTDKVIDDKYHSFYCPHCGSLTPLCEYDRKEICISCNKPFIAIRNLL